MAEEEKGKPAGKGHRSKRRWLLGIPAGGLLAFGMGILALGATNHLFSATSSNEFCYKCHSHDTFVRPEYEASSHFLNATGIRVMCADCHLPKDSWFDLAYTKMVVSFDVIPELQGKIDTAAKFEAHRAEMAETVWRQYKDNDSRLCRSCHMVEAMDFDAQGRIAARLHRRAQENGETCIECHYGLAHALPGNYREILERIAAEHARDLTRKNSEASPEA